MSDMNNIDTMNIDVDINQLKSSCENINNINDEHVKIYGTTVYIGKITLNMVHGDFVAYTFQDLIHKGYIIALCHGNIHSNTLYTRLHSSCVTSETMRSLDCDCVSQLNGAIKKISENDGILFYLIQEGRGCGYVGKSRACMMVQHNENTDNEINTFQAYEKLGMKHDYREYNNVKDICHILNINAQFILLTNNPDKIEKFEKIGMNMLRTESIEIQPNPFNQQYLHSKQQYGHILYHAKTKVSKYVIPHERITPFEPYSLKECKRFIHVSSYYLPIKPVSNNLILDGDELTMLKHMCDSVPLYQIINHNNNKMYYANVSDKLIKENGNTFCKPYWFKANVFYDIVTNNEYIVLEYGDCKNTNNTPIIRIHSESIFNRFPLKDLEYKNRYKKSLEYIIRNGCGLIVILYNDGRGSGLGYYVLNNQQENDKIGVQNDRRDYYGTMHLLSHFLSDNKKITVLHGNTSIKSLEKIFNDHNMIVNKWINISTNNESNGHLSIYERIIQLPSYISSVINDKSIITSLSQLNGYFNENDKICITGIGSSETHAKYLEHLISRYHNAKFVNTMDVSNDYTKLIIFSQGLSPNSHIPIKKFHYKNTVLITTFSPQMNTNESKTIIMNKLQNDPTNIIITYEKELHDDTLIRISGPCVGYILAKGMAREIIGIHNDINNTFNENELSNIFNHDEILSVNKLFINNIVTNKRLIIICTLPEKKYIHNIVNKFIEGCFIDVVVCDYVEFSHGFYQLLKNTNDTHSILLVNNNPNNINNNFFNGIVNMINGNPYHIMNIKDRANSIIEMEIKTNHIVLQLIQTMNINQKNWIGKDTQTKIYSIDSA
jgi:3,4-dihydroxy 2-butanone 4-phosphate synthase/GTP cyclohydrolase II